jgi:hypothetical protein
LSTPTAPKVSAALELPDDLSPYQSYYRYYCGDMGYWGGYYFGFTQSVASVDEGIAFVIQSGTYVPTAVALPDGGSTTNYTWVSKQNLAFLDLRDPSKPSISEIPLVLPGSATGMVDSVTLVPDDMSSSAVYLSYRVQIGSSSDPVSQATLYNYAGYIQQWTRKNGAWQTGSAINIPGSLTRTWGAATGERLLLTRDDTYSTKQTANNYWQWTDTVNLKLLRPIDVNGKAGAEVLDSKALTDVSPRSMVYDGDRIYMTLSNTPYYYGYYYGLATPGMVGGVATSSGAGGAGGGTTAAVDAIDTSDHLVVVDMSQRTLAVAYDQPTELTNLDLMGVSQNKLFVNLTGDGILVVDVANAAAPKGLSFYRTLGYASGIEFVGTSAYVPANYYGTYHIDMTAAGNLY